MGDIEILGLPIAIGSMIYQAVVFTILFWVLKRLVLTKVVTIMETRRKTIEKHLSTSEKLRKEAEVYLQEQLDLLEKARFDSREIIRKSQIEAHEIIQQARTEAAAIRAKSFHDATEKRKRDAI